MTEETMRKAEKIVRSIECAEDVGKARSEIEQLEEVVYTDTDGYGTIQVHVDRTPEKHTPSTVSNPQVEYGIVDLKTSYPSKNKQHTEATERRGLEEISHVEVVPFKVVRDGFSTLSKARTIADRMNRERATKRYHAVATGDTRGI
jgi:hypothetical protein